MFQPRLDERVDRPRPPRFTAGGAGRRTGWKAQWVVAVAEAAKPAGLDKVPTRGSGAPMRTHRSSSATSWSEKASFPLGGICRFSSTYRTALINKLRSTSPGTIAVDRRRRKRSSRVSSLKPP
ncbi:MAG: hypothetical protein U1G07_10340 [Verrucomicrobiota bacterium]